MTMSKRVFVGVAAFTGALTLSAALAITAAASTGQRSPAQAIVSGATTVAATATPSGAITATIGVTGGKIDIAIATHYSIPVTSVIQLRADGWGYGNIVRLYEIARMAGAPVTQVQALRDAGMGWGNIAKEYSLRVGKLNANLGVVLKANKLAVSPLNADDDSQKRKTALAKQPADKSKGPKNAPGKPDNDNSAKDKDKDKGKGKGKDNGDSKKP